MSGSEDALDRSEAGGGGGGTLERGGGGHGSAAPQQRTNSSVHVCWHRATTLGWKEMHASLQVFE